MVERVIGDIKIEILKTSLVGKEKKKKEKKKKKEIKRRERTLQINLRTREPGLHAAYARACSA